jgi:hypothetical protein
MKKLLKYFSKDDLMTIVIMAVLLFVYTLIYLDVK